MLQYAAIRIHRKVINIWYHSR